MTGKELEKLAKQKRNEQKEMKRFFQTYPIFGDVIRKLEKRIFNLERKKANRPIRK